MRASLQLEPQQRGSYSRGLLLFTQASIFIFSSVDAAVTAAGVNAALRAASPPPTVLVLDFSNEFHKQITGNILSLFYGGWRALPFSRLDTNNSISNIAVQVAKTAGHPQRCCVCISKGQRCLHGSDILWHALQMQDRIRIWGVWRPTPRRHLCSLTAVAVKSTADGGEWSSSATVFT